jgi:hypothetical protein
MTTFCASQILYDCFGDFEGFVARVPDTKPHHGGVCVGSPAKNPEHHRALLLTAPVTGFYAETSLKSTFSVMRVPSLRNASASIRIRR